MPSHVFVTSVGAGRLIAFVLALVLAVTMSGLAFWSVREQLRSTESVIETQEVGDQIQALMLNLREMQTSRRGYMLTGHGTFRQQYERERDEVSTSLDRLRGLLAGGPAEADPIRHIAELVLSYISDARDAQLAGPPYDVVAHLSDKSAMAEIEAELVDLLHKRDELRQTHVAETTKQAERTLLTLGAAAAVSAIVLVIAFASTVVEMRRRRRAEEALIRANADLERQVDARTNALREEAAARQNTVELLNAIIEETPFGVVVVDARRRVIVWNRSMMRITGYRQDEIENWPYPQAPGENQSEAEKIYKRLVAGEVLRDVELPRLRKDGRSIDLLIAAAPLYNADRGLRGIVFVCEDVTQRRQTEQQLRQAQRMDAVGQLAAGISHDFNNLLNAIVINLDLVMRRASDNPMVTELVPLALRAALRGADLTHRLLAFSQPMPVELHTVDVNTRLPDLFALLRRTLGEGIELVLRPAPDLWPIVVDPSQLDVAITNLVINARDAMADAGQIIVETANHRRDDRYGMAASAIPAGEYTTISVHDTGVGMSAKVAERAFEPFFTTKETGKGTGLGLSMVYGFVQQCGGHAVIDSELGHGTTVTLFIPRGSGAAQPERPRDTVALAPGGTETVLLAEDDVEVRQSTIEALKTLGYVVHAVADAKAALDVLDTGARVDLLFTDIVMPGSMDGYALARAARMRRPMLKILFASAHARHVAGDLAESAGLGPMIAKPYRMDDLAAALRRVLTTAQAA
jgi:PAS domain S-box-containing protein